MGIAERLLRIQKLVSPGTVAAPILDAGVQSIVLVEPVAVHTPKGYLLSKIPMEKWASHLENARLLLLQMMTQWNGSTVDGELVTSESVIFYCVLNKKHSFQFRVAHELIEWDDVANHSKFRLVVRIEDKYVNVSDLHACSESQNYGLANTAVVIVDSMAMQSCVAALVSDIQSKMMSRLIDVGKTKAHSL